MAVKNLWGDLPPADAKPTPIKVLREQASVLTEISGGLLQGIVGTNSSGGLMALELYVKVPALNHYMYLLARVTHNPVSVYPLKIKDSESPQWDEASNEDQFVQALQKILSSEHTRTVLQSLMAQAKALEET